MVLKNFTLLGFGLRRLLRLVSDTAALRIWTAPAERERRRRFRAHMAGGGCENISCVRKWRGTALPTVVQDAGAHMIATGFDTAP